MSSRKNKNFLELSDRQKRRRIAGHLRENSSVRAPQCSEEIKENSEATDAQNEDCVLDVNPHNHDTSDNEVINSDYINLLTNVNCITEAVSEIPDNTDVDIDTSYLTNSKRCSSEDIYNFDQQQDRTYDYSIALSSGIKKWLSSEKQVPHSAVDRLLEILHDDFPSLPLSSKTILDDQSSQFSISEMGTGEYLKINWIDHLSNYLRIKLDTEPHCKSDKLLHFAINIDGIPLYHGNTRYHAYPILGKVLQYPDKVFCCGIYCSNKIGLTSLPDANIFLKSFLDDFQTLQTEFLALSLGPFICDAPMRAYLKNIKLHSGYSSCERCDQAGEYHERSVVFPYTNLKYRARSDSNFKDRVDEQHHKSDDPNILELQGFPMITGFVLDHMHLCFLGIMRRYLLRLREHKLFYKKRVNLSSRAKCIFDERLEICSKHLPDEFDRRLEGGIAKLLTWKATEFRTFLLYLGPFIFKSLDVVPKIVYENFICFSTAMKLLLLSNQMDNIEIIENLLSLFFTSSIEIFGKGFATYNVHSLLHLTEDYKKYGNLENISCFSYETYLGAHVKGAIRSGFKPLQQIAKHVTKINVEETNTDDAVGNLPKCSIEYKNCGHKEQCGICYKILKLKNFVIKTAEYSLKNSGVLLRENCVGIVKAIHKHENNVHVLVEKKLNKSNIYEKPVKSEQLGIYQVSCHSSSVHWCNSKDIIKKLIVVPFNDQYYVAVLPHTNA